MALVDVQISGETASSVPVQIIGDSRYPTVPTDCSSSAPTAEDTVATFGANGILGIGPFAQDCGELLRVERAGARRSITRAPPRRIARARPSPDQLQVPNPVTLFATDNNGTIITLPSVADAGASDVTGSLIFGIDTESNNASGIETVVPISKRHERVPDHGVQWRDFDGELHRLGLEWLLLHGLEPHRCTQSGFTDFYCPASADP